MADFDAKYVLVPREPTQEMIDAGEAKDCPAATYSGYAEERATAEDHYRAMIAAAPALPNSDEVAGMVEQVRIIADGFSRHDDDELADKMWLEKAATLLEALDLALRLRERDDPDAGIRGWNSLHDLVAQAREYLALPPAADDDVAEMVGWLQDAATHEDDKDQRTGLRRGAAMLEALSQSREADRVRARNEGIEMAAKCIEAKHAHNIGGVVHPIAQSDAAAIRALKDRL